MTARCQGCGVVLQYTNPRAPGYTPKAGSLYCQRCFRLIHYDDLQFSMRQGIDPETVMTRLESMNGIFLWTVDLFDFEAGMIPGLSRHLAGKQLVFIGTKRDLLPDTVRPEKLSAFVKERLGEQGIRPAAMAFVTRQDLQGLNDLAAWIEKKAYGRKAIFFGRANSGKSTLINSLLHSTRLTSSRYPGTTLDFQELEHNGVTYVDSPGIEVGQSMLMDVEEKVLRDLVPSAAVRPEVYQVYEDQSFALGGLARLDVLGARRASVVFYRSDRIPVHRGSYKEADGLWQRQFGRVLRPVPLEAVDHVMAYHKDREKVDVVWDGLGWACISGDVKTIRVMSPAKVNVTFRKAIL